MAKKAQKGKKPRERQRPAPFSKQAQPLLSFFQKAGLSVRVEKGYLTIDGKTAFKVPPPGRILQYDWDNVIDRIVLAQHSKHFRNSVHRHQRIVGKRVSVKWSNASHAFAFIRNEHLLGLLKPTVARVPGSLPIHGNYLVEGTHWYELARALERRYRELGALTARAAEQEGASEAEMPTNQPEPRFTVITSPPPEVVPDLVDLCLEASRRIRTERTLVFSHTLRLHGDYGKIDLQPIAGEIGRLHVDFTLRRRGSTVNGALLLSAGSEPVPIRIEGRASPDERAAAWAGALLGFATATCVEIVESPKRVSPVLPTWPRRPRSTPRPAEPRVLRRTRYLSDELEPIGRTRHLIGSLVAGHRRRLLDGQSASREARDRALRAGIELGQRETYVQPHVRGVPHDVLLEFRWAGPKPLRSLAGLALAP